MSDAISEAGDVRVAIGQYVRDVETAMRDELVGEVATVEGVSESTVERQLELLQKEGLIYLVNEEVRVP